MTPNANELNCGPELIDVERELRKEWWLNHGHDLAVLYGDDGEMVCHACPADFKRGPLGELHGLVFRSRTGGVG